MRTLLFIMKMNFKKTTEKVTACLKTNLELLSLSIIYDVMTNDCNDDDNKKKYVFKNTVPYLSIILLLV